MYNLDLRMRLLAGEPLEIDGIGLIYPPKLKDLVHIGYQKYAQYLWVMTLDADQIIGRTKVQNIDINGFDIIANSESEDVIDMFSEAIKFFTKEEEIYFSIGLQTAFIGEYTGIKSAKKINRDNYNSIKEYIEYMACLKTPNAEEKMKENPMNEKARKIMEKIKRDNNYINKKKNKEDSDDGFDLVDIVSAVTVKSNNINKFNVWDLTLYQLYDEYKRLETIGQYDIGLQSIIHGADSKKIHLKHWSARID